MSALALVGLTVGPAPPDRQGHDLHQNLSLEIAFNRAECGRRSMISPVFSLSRQLEERPALATVSLRELAASAAGTPESYCSTATQPFQNNENSLMLEMALFLEVAPSLSLEQLGWGLQVTRVIAFLALALVLVEGGASVGFAALNLAAGLAILAHLDHRYYSVYPFGPALLALIVATLSAAYLASPVLGHGGRLAAAAAAGWLIAFAANMRTSHFPVYVVLLAIYFAAVHRRLAAGAERPSAARRLGWLAASAASAAAAYALFGWLFIRPLAAETARGPSYSYHVIAHPLVLALAVPEGPLSRREGIRWDDAVGITLARRTDPSVEYMRAGYEAALWKYYIGLWDRHRGEMLGTYATKLKVAGRDMIDTVFRVPNRLIAAGVLRVALMPLAWVPDGAWLLASYAAILLAALLWVFHHDSTIAFTTALVSAAAVLLQLEAALVYSLFERSHHGAALLCFVFLVALVWQLAVESLHAAFVARRRRRCDRASSAPA